MVLRLLLAASATLIGTAGIAAVAGHPPPVAPSAAAPVSVQDHGDIDPFPFGACVTSSRLDHPICVFVDPGQG